MPVLKEDDTMDSDLVCAHCRTHVFCRARLENDSFRQLRDVELKNDPLEVEVPEEEKVDEEVPTTLKAMILGGLGLPTVTSIVGRLRGLDLVVTPESGLFVEPMLNSDDDVRPPIVIVALLSFRAL
jgi:hypothetical protein